MGYHADKLVLARAQRSQHWLLERLQFEKLIDIRLPQNKNLLLLPLIELPSGLLGHRIVQVLGHLLLLLLGLAVLYQGLKLEQKVPAPGNDVLTVASRCIVAIKCRVRCHLQRHTSDHGGLVRSIRKLWA